MKIAFYMEDGLEQIVLTPESDTEKAMLEKLHDGTRALDVKKGSFYHCRGGWQRYQPHAIFQSYGGYAEDTGDESTMLVLRAKPIDDDPTDVR